MSRNYQHIFALSAAVSSVVLATAQHGLGTTIQAYCAITGTFNSSADRVDVDFSFTGAASLQFAGHSNQGGINIAGDTVPGGGVDSEIRLFDNTGKIIASDDDSGPGADPLLLVSPLSAGSYRAQSDLADASRPLGNGGWSMDIVADQFF